MAYEEKLAERIRQVLKRRRNITEIKMFGGLGFMLRGHMCCGVIGDELMVRVGAEAYEDALRRKHAREMDFTGQPLRGFVYVAAKGIRTSSALKAWVDLGVLFTQSLPPKDTL